MDLTTATNRLAQLAQGVFEADMDARKRLTEALAIDGAHIVGLMDAALVTAANAKPWHELMRRIQRLGVRDALAVMRQEATDALLSYGFGMSTSPVENAARFAEQEGLRCFLNRTNLIEIDEAPAPVKAESAEEPVPAPQPNVKVAAPPKVTPAQRRTLAAIKTQGVKLQEFTVKEGIKVTVESGEKPRKDMVEYVISQGWARQDHTRPLFKGQPVTLTDIGEAILGG
jgi:hypothetical protein